MKLAMIGCGYVANMYRAALPLYPRLELVGVLDRDAERARTMAEMTGAKVYADLDEALADGSVEMVLNFTNPRAHLEVTTAALNAGKHVYTEKPLAMEHEDAVGLVALAKEKNLVLSSAPCTLFAEAAQTLWKAVHEEAVGPIRLVYAEMDDGMVHRMPVEKWVNEAGVTWPYVDEFETGCTVEHGGYVLTWLCAMFGPAESLVAFADELVPMQEKLAAHPGASSPMDHVDDFSVLCVRFKGGQVARVTCGIYAAHDHGMTAFGDDGVLHVDDPRVDRSPVRLRRYHTIRRKRFLSPLSRKLKLIGKKQPKIEYRGGQTRDFLRGVSETCEAIEAGRAPTLGADFALHVNEIVLAAQNARAYAAAGKMPYTMTTTFEPIRPGGHPKEASGGG